MQTHPGDFGALRHPGDFGALRFTAGLAFRSTGQGHSLLLLHGGSGSRNHWSRNVRELSKHLRVLTVDLPGLGESASPPAGITDDEYLARVGQAIEEHLAGEPFDMAGFSFGGATTSIVAAALSARGCGPRRITLVSPSGFGMPEKRKVVLEKIKRGADHADPELRAATARNLGVWMLSSTPARGDPAVDLHLHNLARARFDSRTISYRDSTLDALRAAGVPVQFLLGKADPLIFPSVAARSARIREALPNARVEALAGAHWLQYEASNAVNRRIAKFHLPRSSP